jgi:short-subunit dehydrogenase
LITGASSGLGAAFARRLSPKHDLLLVARREKRLAQLAEELSGGTGRVDYLVADLTQAEGLTLVEERLRAESSRLEVLISNAGFGTFDRFCESPLERELDMIRLHIIATTRLCHVGLPAMVRRGRGALINVASISAMLPGVRMATYGASKAFLKQFTECLHLEVRSSGVRVQVLCPGFTETEFHTEIKGFRKSAVPHRLWMSADAVVSCSLRALEKGRVLCIPGIRNRLFVYAGDRQWLTQFLWKAWILLSSWSVKANHEVRG